MKTPKTSRLTVKGRPIAAYTAIPPSGNTGAAGSSLTIPGSGNTAGGAGVLSNGVFQVNFAVGLAPSTLLLPGTVTNETGCISVFGPTVQGPLSTAFTQWRNNSAATPALQYAEFGEYANFSGDNTAGAEFTQYGIDVMSNGVETTAFRVLSTQGAAGTIQVVYNLTSAAHPSIGTANDRTSGYGWAASAGSGTDLLFSYGGVEAFRFGQDASAGSFLHITAVSGNGAYLKLGPNLSGWFYDTVNGGIFGDAVASSVAIGLSGARATNTTSGFLALPTCAGTPTGAPANVTSGKACAIIDTSANKLWVNFGSTTWKSVALT